MSRVIYGSELAIEMKEAMRQEIEVLNNNNKRAPKLVVILVGEDPASVSYVTGKEKACKEIAMDSDLIRLPENTTQEKLEELIDSLNNDQQVDGILVQLPLPSHLSQKEILLRISPEKDVDGLHPINAGRLMLKENGFVPCTPRGIMELLKKAEVELSGKRVCVIGRSNLVGNPVAQLLIQANATVTVCHSRTENIEAVCKEADILIVAIGKAKLVNKKWIKKNAVVIDVGVNRLNGKLCGDVDFDDVLDHVSVITPVPKGVGPMTITMLLKNTLKAYYKKEENRNYD